MKKKISVYVSSLALCFIIIAAMNSCKKTGLVSKELLLYVKGDYGAVNNSVIRSLTWTPLAVWGNRNFSIPVYATHEVAADIDAYIYPDDRPIAQFNQANNTNYQLLPPNAYNLLNGYKRKIKSGSLVSTDSLMIQLTDVISTLNDTRGYILPLTVTKYESEDKGPVISTNQGTVFLIFPYVYTNVDTVQSLLATGTQISRTGWSATVSNTFSGTYPATNLLDGNNSTAWRSSNSASAAKWFIINMGSSMPVSGFKLCPDYVTTTENPTQMTISTSDDNVTYKVQGIWKGTGPATGSSATSPDWKGVNFIVPVTARYFQFTINTWVSTNVAGIGEVYGIQ